MQILKELGGFVAGERVASSKSSYVLAQSLMEVKEIRQGWRCGKDKE